MKVTGLTLCCAFLLTNAYAQGVFQNLNFESPIPPFTPSGPLNHVPATNALPGWTVYLGEPYDQVRLNQVTIGGAAVSLLDPDYGSGVIEGSYTVVLSPGVSPSGGSRVAASIGQIGQIPFDAQSLQFFAFGPQITVAFAGESLSLIPLESGPNFSTLYGADISVFAGQTGELRFTAPDLIVFPNNVFLDGIFFSPEAIPEPGAISLLALGAFLFGWRKVSRRK